MSSTAQGVECDILSAAPSSGLFSFRRFCFGNDSNDIHRLVLLQKIHPSFLPVRCDGLLQSAIFPHAPSRDARRFLLRPLPVSDGIPGRIFAAIFDGKASPMARPCLVSKVDISPVFGAAQHLCY